MEQIEKNLGNFHKHYSPARIATLFPPHQFTSDHSEELINTFTSSHFSKEAWIAMRRGACVWENFADLALVEVIDDGVVERLFELPLSL